MYSGSSVVLQYYYTDIVFLCFHNKAADGGLFVMDTKRLCGGRGQCSLVPRHTPAVVTSAREGRG